jgi:hypothetical protein
MTHTVFETEKLADHISDICSHITYHARILLLKDSKHFLLYIRSYASDSQASRRDALEVPTLKRQPRPTRVRVLHSSWPFSCKSRQSHSTAPASGLWPAGRSSLTALPNAHAHDDVTSQFSHELRHGSVFRFCQVSDATFESRLSGLGNYWLMRASLLKAQSWKVVNRWVASLPLHVLGVHASQL